ncbi:MAG: hypothetical protein ACTSO4_15330, partial [Promethearchaeota archaeon]
MFKKILRKRRQKHKNELNNSQITVIPITKPKKNDNFNDSKQEVSEDKLNSYNETHPTLLEDTNTAEIKFTPKESSKIKEPIQKDVSEKKYLKPKRMSAPSFKTKRKHKEPSELNSEQLEYIQESKIIDEFNLAEEYIKYKKIPEQEKISKKSKNLITSRKSKSVYIVNRPRIYFEAELGKMLLMLPVIAFNSFEDFSNHYPIYCNIEIIDANKKKETYKEKLTEMKCRIKNSFEEKIYLELFPFKEFSCTIESIKSSFFKKYSYSHMNENLYIFIEESDKILFIYNTKRFFKEDKRFWILVKKKFTFSTEPIGIMENIIYPDYTMYNFAFKPNEYEICIYDDYNNLIERIFREPKIKYFYKSDDCIIFDNYFYEEPLFCKEFSIKIECSKVLNRYPKLLHIQNSIIKNNDDQFKFHKEFKWMDNEEFIINFELLDKRIGSYQIDIIFFEDNSYKNPLFNKSVRGHFRFCPISIIGLDKIIFPTMDGHNILKCNISPIVNENFEIKKLTNSIQLKTAHDKNKTYFIGTIPENIDKFEIILIQKEKNSIVKIKPLIPRVKWRIKNLSGFEDFTGKTININFDNQFSMKFNAKIEIAIFIIKANLSLKLQFEEKSFSIPQRKDNRFLYSFPLNSIYEDILRIISRKGELTINLNIQEKILKIINFSGKIKEFYEHELPTPRRRLRIERTRIIYTPKNIITELKIRGYTKNKPRRVVATLISLLSEEL